MKGDELEAFYSEKIHRQGIPLLISPLVLRKYGCGQVDLAHFLKSQTGWRIQLYEVKSSPYISFKQKIRLRKSLLFLQQLFKMDVYLTFVAGQKK